MLRATRSLVCGANARQRMDAAKRQLDRCWAMSKNLKAWCRRGAERSAEQRALFDPSADLYQPPLNPSSVRRNTPPHPIRSMPAPVADTLVAPR